MPLMASEGESKPKQQPPAGTHVARCYSVIDLGTQETPWGAKHQIRISWELPEETAVFKEENGPQPFSVHKKYTLSLFEKSVLRHDLQSWRGKEFTEDERKGFDIFNLLGVPCMLNIIHNESKGQMYANVAGVMKLPKGMKCPDQVNPSVQFEIDEGKSVTFVSLPKWLQEIISASEEWQGGQNHPDPVAVEPDSEEPF